MKRLTAEEKVKPQEKFPGAVLQYFEDVLVAIILPPTLCGTPFYGTPSKQKGT